MDLTYVDTHSHHPGPDTAALQHPGGPLMLLSVNYCPLHPKVTTIPTSVTIDKFRACDFNLHKSVVYVSCPVS